MTWLPDAVHPAAGVIVRMAAMEPLRLDDILGRDRYGAEREAIRRRLVTHKKTRRVAVGDRMTFVFEDRATVWYQTQEMTWVEHITDLDGIRDELAVYNALLPDAHDLSATLLIEITDSDRIREALERLLGIDRHVRLVIGDSLAVPAVFEGGRQTEVRLSAVQYVRFPIGAAGCAAITRGASMAIAIDHPEYVVSVVLPEVVRAAIAAELADPAAAEAALRHVREGR